jgi:hypothetical protein
MVVRHLLGISRELRLGHPSGIMNLEVAAAAAARFLENLWTAV